MSERPVVPLTVKPRKAATEWRYIVAVDRDALYLERTGELLHKDNLASLVACEQPFMLVGHNVDMLVAELDEIYDDHPKWQFRLTPITREVWRPNRLETALLLQNTVVNFFGFSRVNGHGTNRYHQCLDPVLLTKKSIAGGVMGLYQWASDVRDWCLLNGISPKTTAGGIGAQLLRDHRFYPNPRRKVPKATNEKAREQLPGNYYRLFCQTNKRYAATYYDQSAAHHNCAKDVDLPNADTLYARGYFGAMARPYWARAGTRLFKKELGRPGLYYLGIRNPAKVMGGFPLPCQEKAGYKRAFVWSNEIAHLQATGTIIEGIVAAWTGETLDTGIQDYAEWALQQDRDQYPWLKSVLLSTYGILASKPRRFEFGYKRAKTGTPRMYPVGNRLIAATARVGEKEVEPGFVNVIHRGIIEAETRLRSIQWATHLKAEGFTVLAIYADSVFIEDAGRNLPFPEGNWRIQEYLTSLIFYNEVSFSSDQIEKLPGIPKDDADRLSRVKQMKAVINQAAKTRDSVRPGR